MIVVIGCDPSSKKLATVTTYDDADVEVAVRVLPSEKPIQDRCAIAYNWVYRMVRKLVNAGHEVNFFIEDPVFVPKAGAHTTIIQARVNGAVMAASINAGATMTFGVHNQRWKSIACGSGSVSKAQVSAYWITHWPALSELAGKDQDIKDAAGINRYGAKHVMRELGDIEVSAHKSTKRKKK